MILERLDALCRHYGVDHRDISEEPVLALARRYVPGFQIDRGGRSHTGTRKKWDDIRLAQLWLRYRAVRSRFTSDKAATAYLSRQKELEGITGKVEPVWVKQLLEKAKRSPLVQMMESDRPADRKFASKFLATHDCE
jgi:hypothetical protein